MAFWNKKKKIRANTAPEYIAPANTGPVAGANDTNFFWQSKYTTGTSDSRLEPTSFVDATDALANGGQFVISFKTVAAGESVFFKAFISDYSETYNSEWKGNPVFGRTDPIYTYGNTRRTISFGFDVPASSESEAFENMGRIQLLTQMLYPTYKATPGNDGNSQPLLEQSPLIRIKMMNLIQKAADHEGTGPDGNSRKNILEKRNQIYQSYLSTSDPDRGLLCVINNVSISTELSKEGVLEKGPNTIMPVNYKVKVDCAVIHETTVGWDSDGNALTPTFPYGATSWDPTGAKLGLDADQNWAARLDKERNLQAASDTANAKYSGWFGKMRAKNDMRRHEDNQKFMMGIPWSGMPGWLGGGERDPATEGSYEDYLGDAASDAYMDHVTERR